MPKACETSSARDVEVRGLQWEGGRGYIPVRSITPEQEIVARMLIRIPNISVAMAVLGHG